jgi:excisionase family DNA binding protein
MSLNIAGSDYWTTAEVCDVAGVSRQTLWRWRQEGHIPAGRRLRGQRLLFSREDVEKVREYALLVEPADQPSRAQLKLFGLEQSKPEA